MTWGNFGAASGAQPIANQPTGVQPFAPGAVSQPPGQAGATLPACYNSGFESLMAAVSRGEVSLNSQILGATSLNGITPNPYGSAVGNPTLLQAFSQGLGQNGTNGLNGVGASGGTVNSGSGSTNTGSVTLSSLSGGGGFTAGGTQIVDAKTPMSLINQLLFSGAAAQYGGA
jgi:hypothetical protein